MPAKSFTRSILQLFSSPIIWAAHFLLVYGFIGLVCARPGLQQEWLGASIVTWGIGAITLPAVAGIIIIHLRAWQTRVERQGDLPDFMHWTALGLAVLSMIAIIWEAIPVFLVPHCS